MVNTLLCLCLASAGQSHDTILVVDMSLSLVEDDLSNPGTKASDPEGLHWDAIDFIINSSEDKDRILLQVFRANSFMASQVIAGPSGFVEIGKNYVVGKKTANRQGMA